jgi:hypothetical protein
MSATIPQEWRGAYASARVSSDRELVYFASRAVAAAIAAGVLFYSIRSRLQYAAKHFGVPGYLAVTATSLLVEPLVRAVLAVARVDFKTLRNTAQGYTMLYSWFAGSVLKLRYAA